jgi:sulfatase maturation enzyme AslB (radical SAM superfamily)
MFIKHTNEKRCRECDFHKMCLQAHRKENIVMHQLMVFFHQKRSGYEKFIEFKVNFFY